MYSSLKIEQILVDFYDSRDSEYDKYYPERRLFVAVLERAVQDYLNLKDSKLENCAASWFKNDDQEQIPSDCITFGHVCLILDIEPTSLKRAVDRIKKGLVEEKEKLLKKKEKEIRF